MTRAILTSLALPLLLAASAIPESYRYAGRDFRLTNVSGKVARAIIT